MAIRVSDVSSKRAKNAFLVFLVHFRAHVGQSDGHIGWATLMPLHQSILLTQGPISLNFAKKYWELTVWQNEVFLSRPFWIFFFKKNFFCFIPFQISHKLRRSMNQTQFLFSRQKLGGYRIMNSTVNYFGKNVGSANSLMTSNLLICST